MLIKNTRIIDPASGLDVVGDIYIRDGRIERISVERDDEKTSSAVPEAVPSATSDVGSSPAGPDADVIDGTGLVCAPGLVDVHVHFRDPGFTYKEDIESGARAAAAGGFTSVVMMANTKPAIDNAETLEYVLNKASSQPVHVYTCADITKGLRGEELTDMDLLAGLGAVGFTDDGIPLRDARICRKAMEEAARLGMPLSFHEEDPSFIMNNGINAGEASDHYGVGGSPRDAEISMIKRDIELAAELISGAENSPDIVIQHISSAEGVQLVREARKHNPHIHAEATPHHFSLTERSLIKYGTMAKMNPPLRTESDRLAIIEGLRDKTIELISTDHAPHSAEEKSRPVTEAPSGIIGLETSLALGITTLVKGIRLEASASANNEPRSHMDNGSELSGEAYVPPTISLSEFLACMTVNPANLYKLDAGRIYEGGPADLVLFDPDEEWTVSDHFESRSSNSPFIGMRLYGRVHMTVCGGRIVFTGS